MASLSWRAALTPSKPGADCLAIPTTPKAAISKPLSMAFCWVASICRTAIRRLAQNSISNIHTALVSFAAVLVLTGTAATKPATRVCASSKWHQDRSRSGGRATGGSGLWIW